MAVSPDLVADVVTSELLDAVAVVPADDVDHAGSPALLDDVVAFSPEVATDPGLDVVLPGSSSVEVVSLGLVMTGIVALGNLYGGLVTVVMTACEEEVVTGRRPHGSRDLRPWAT